MIAREEQLKRAKRRTERIQAKHRRIRELHERQDDPPDPYPDGHETAKEVANCPICVARRLRARVGA